MLVNWAVVFAKQAVEDARKIAAAGLKPKAQGLLDVLRHDPFQNPPPFEKLVGDLEGAYRRINIQHRLVYRSVQGRAHGARAAHVDALRMSRQTGHRIDYQHAWSSWARSGSRVAGRRWRNASRVRPTRCAW